MAEIVFGKLGETREATERRVRMAARALGRNDLGHAFGHVSARLDDTSFLVCAPRPMGLIAKGEPGTVVPIEGALPAGVLGEVRIHQQIYKRRADVNGICRTFLKNTMALSTLRMTAKPRDGFGSYFAPGPKLWDDPTLLRNDEAAAKLAETLGAARAIVMRGNGAVMVGATVEEATCMAFFLEEASRTEVSVLGMNLPGYEAIMTAEQAAARGVTTGNILERLWEYLTRDDPENQ
jgi:HCOMODA/2-hydroxy-3-carboxy-muconic semialdehyde decarboxylase